MKRKIDYSLIGFCVFLFLSTTLYLSGNTFNSIGSLDHYHYTHNYLDLLMGVTAGLAHAMILWYVMPVARIRPPKPPLKAALCLLKIGLSVGVVAAGAIAYIYSRSCLGEECMGTVIVPAFIVPMSLFLAVFYFMLMKKRWLDYYLIALFLFDIYAGIMGVRQWDSDCPVHGRYDRLSCIENKAIATHDTSLCDKLYGGYPGICRADIPQKLKTPGKYSNCDQIYPGPYACLILPGK